MMIVVIVIVIIVVAAAYFLLSRGPSFAISVSPSTVTISRGGTENITLSYNPKPPSNLSMSNNVTGPGPGVQFGEWIDPPFTFPVVVSENAAPGTYTVTLEATDVDTGAKATTTFTVNVTST